MYEFGLKYEKLQKSGILDIVVPIQLCLVPLPNTFCMVVPVPNGFCMVVPVPPCFGTGTTSWFFPEMLLFALFGTIFLHTTSPFHNTSKTNMEFIQNHTITLVLVVWNFIQPRVKILTIQPKVPQFLQNHIIMMDSMFILYQLRFYPHNFNKSRV